MFLEVMAGFEQVMQNPEIKQALGVLGVGGLIALGIALIFLILIILLALYVYMAFAWMTIARKLGYKNSWLAWIPIANFFLLPILAKKHWAWGFILLIPIVNIIFIVFWLWKIYERRNYSGWLSLVIIAHFIPVISAIALIANLVIFGMVAWRDKGKTQKVKPKARAKPKKRSRK